MMGYWERPEETKKAVIDGWMHTGDGGYMDEDGYVYIVDRIKDMIISGGENIYSAEVENCIAQHPAVAQCAVIGVPATNGARRCIVPYKCPGHRHAQDYSLLQGRSPAMPAQRQIQDETCCSRSGARKVSSCLIGPLGTPTRAACRLSKRMEALIHADGEL